MGQSNRSQPPEAVSARAQEEDFGAPVDGVGGRTQVLQSLGFALLFGVLAVLCALWNTNPRFFAVILAVVFGVFAALALVLAETFRGRATWVFERGIVEYGRGEATTLAFRDLTGVLETQSEGAGAASGQEQPTIRAVQLIQGDRPVRAYQGEVGTLSDAVGAAVLQAFYRETMSNVRDRVGAGEVVDFRAFAVGKDGLHLPDRVVPWSELQQARDTQGTVQFTPRRGTAFAFPFSEVRGGSATVALVNDVIRAAAR